MSTRERSRKPVTIRLGAHIYVADRAVQLVLSDSPDDFDHPHIRVSFDRPGSDLPTTPIRLAVAFQRHIPPDPGEEADGYMDTRRRWSRCYAGAIEFTRDSHSVRVEDRPFRMGVEDRLAIALARKLGRVINEYNLRLVDSDDCVQVVLALEKLGFSVRRMYQRGIGKPIDLHEIDDRGANRRAAARRAARNVSSATSSGSTASAGPATHTP